MQLVSHLAAPQLGVVLLGDAAHNVTPQMGQVSKGSPADMSQLLGTVMARPLLQLSVCYSVCHSVYHSVFLTAGLSVDCP